MGERGTGVGTHPDRNPRGLKVLEDRDHEIEISHGSLLGWKRNRGAKV